jgi:putative flippase GtrA
LSLSRLDRQPIRFIVNGLVATAIHFVTLTCLIEVAPSASAGLASMVAAVFGIAASFLGNRHFVYRSTLTSWERQLGRFWTLYCALAVLHGLALFLWTDVAGLDYRIGFLLATAAQAVCTYLGGGKWVFRV